MPKLPKPFLPLAALLLLLAATAAQAAEYVWLEGEAPTYTNLKPNIAGWGRKEFLSGEKWLHISIDADQVEKALPAGGGVIQYTFTVPQPGSYEIWNRVGFEFVRSPFSWRLDGGQWQTVTPEQLTTDLMELDTWCEVAWLKMGERELSAGAHTLEIGLPKTTDPQGMPARILYASDAFCLSKGPFDPRSRLKPDESGRAPADEEAARHVFELPAPASPAARSSVKLGGLWEICRHDEELPGETAEPIRELPARPFWSAIRVPGDKNDLRPDLLFAHRLWYRTRVNVPESLAGRSFHLVFPQNNLNTTVYVNGVYCGFDKNPFARVQIDVTRGIQPGANEIRVGIRDAWYGYSTNPKDPMKLRRKFNLPLSVARGGFQDLAYPIWNAFQSGILVAPELVSAGPVKAADVFCKPSVVRKELAVEVSLANTASGEVKGELFCQAVDAKTGEIAVTLPAQPFALGAGASQTVQAAGRWENPKLWWPGEPNMYRLRAVVKVDGQPVDISETPFGFREWSSTGKDFILNGIPWHGWADTCSADTKENWLAFYRKSNQSMMRFWGTSWMGLPPEQALDFFDQNGVVVRRSGMLDGQMIGYNAIETDPDLQKESPVKMDLMRNWRDHLLAQVREERNHPSIMIWSIENEWLYINCINLYGDLMDKFEAEVAKVSDAILKADSTRFTMTDGGGANKGQTMPVHGNHYVFDPNDTRYPDLAYRPNPGGGGRGRWLWDEKRPRFLGEDYFANGINPFDYAYFGGEEAFQGKAQTRRAAGLIYRMLTEGYRWAGFGAWHFWLGQESAVEQYGSNAPLAVFCRQWDWTFGSGQKVRRTFGIFNDTRFSDPVTFTYSLMLGKRRAGGGKVVYRIPAGTSRKFDLTLPIPAASARQEARLILALQTRDKEVFRDVKDISILPPAKPGPAWPGAKALLVYDPKGTVRSFLKSIKAPFTVLPRLNALPAGGKVLIIGKDALDAAESGSSRLAAYASAGRRVIILEQKNPLRYQALPAEMEATPAEGRTAFGEDMGHPVLKGLRQKDFFTWGPDGVVYRNAYLKPARGGKSLVQCHTRLQNTALAEIPAGQGLLLLSPLAIGEKLAANAPARQLLVNMISYAAQYRLEYREAAAAAGDDPELVKAMDAVGLKYRQASGPLEALDMPGVRLAVISASPAHLKELAANPDRVKRFTQKGGYLVLHGLAPEGLADYNRLVGFDHMIRPFRMERVTLPPVKHPLTSGLTMGDVVMLSGERIFGWTSDEFLASDIFSYIVDYDEAAPFAAMPSDYHYNMVNGMVSADAWKYIFSFDLNAGPPEFTMTFPKEQTFTELEWIGNAFYHLITKIELTFDGRMESVLSLATRPSNEPQTFAISPPRKGKTILFRIADWNKVSPSANVVGIDNIRLKALRSPGFYRQVRPMLNIGGLMEYPRGAGGIVFCNLLFKDSETVPLNAVKKRAILAAILRNLKAPFSGSGQVIAGSKLAYRPLDISGQANQYRSERGWFGDPAFTFKDMPAGRQSFAGVPFMIYDFPTSPVPTVLMLGGPGIPNNPAEEIRGIPVGSKADALFFLHTARIDAPMSDRERQENKRYEMARYTVTYEDGQTAAIPIYSEIDIADYRPKTPAPLPGAQIAWTRHYPGSGGHAVAYMKQWNNPRPDAAIRSIDFTYGPDRRGVPALIAVTAARKG
ncbi:MAG: hypothetical protein IT210_18030 [Armatimonadetes bacterium]|nr:hypothetical protein [Armatimonadota bacterium]